MINQTLEIMMNHLKIICLSAFFITSLSLKSQSVENNPVVMEIGSEKIYLSEFLDQFSLDQEQLKTIDKETLNEYLNLYLNFKLKIKEGYLLGLDTLEEFKHEFSEYREKAFSRYLYDKDTYEKTINELYRRLQYAAKASHVLILSEQYAVPADTLAAYKKAVDIRNRILKGESINDLAVELSDDSTARKHHNMYEGDEIEGNRGDLGFITALSTHPAFEEFIFTSGEKSLSMPVRTDKGYHIIYLEKRIPFYDRAVLDHIWVSENDSRSDSLEAKQKIFEAYEAVNKGADFNQTAKQFSDERNVENSGGRVSGVSVNNMIPEYAAALSALDINQISEPFHTPYGWHIVRMVEKSTIPPLDDIMSTLEFRMERSGRKKPAVDKFVQDQKTARGFKEVPEKELNIALKEIESSLNDSIFRGTWNIPYSSLDYKKPLFIINGQWFNQRDFLIYIAQNQHNFKGKPYLLSAYTTNLYNHLIENAVMKIADNLFEQEIPTLNKTVKAFHEGLLVYAYNEKEIWNKAVYDTAGLEKFYESTKNNHSTVENMEYNPYMWSKRANMVKWTITDKNCFDIEKNKKIIERSLSKNIDENIVCQNILKTVKKNCKEKDNLVKYEVRLTEQVPNFDMEKAVNIPIILTKTTDSNTVVWYVIKNIHSPELKSLAEAKGYYINDYQTYLEEQNNNILRNKYPHSIHFEIFQ